MNELLSVIVPIYKGEPYLRKCFDSILSNTYRNIELILVDDGSPDKSGEICDEYATKDTRIKVIHQVNQGASMAYNNGIKAATGEYITFVDNDDWIESDEFALVMDRMEKTNCDIVLFNYVEEYKNKQVKNCIDLKKYYNTDTIKYGFICDQIGSYVWRGVYKKAMWQGIELPQNTHYEDLATFIDVIMRATKIELIDKCLYHYNFTNVNSITMNVDSKSKYGMFLSAKKRMQYGIDLHDEKLYRRYQKRAFKTAVTGLGIDAATHELWPKQLQLMKDYLENNNHAKNVDVGVKYHLIKWGIFHCPLIPKLYGEGMMALQKIKKVFR